MGLQDQELAHRQEPLLQHYFTPSKADVAVRCVRRWYSECAQAIPWAIGAARVGKAATREELLDRFHTHTANCTSCRQVGAASCQAACVLDCWLWLLEMGQLWPHT